MTKPFNHHILSCAESPTGAVTASQDPTDWRWVCVDFRADVTHVRLGKDGPQEDLNMMHSVYRYTCLVWMDVVLLKDGYMVMS